MAKSAAIITLAAASAFATGMAVAWADPGTGGTQVPLKGALRYCDSSQVKYPPGGTEATLGSGTARIYRSGSKAVADVYLFVSASPNTHFAVGLIQTPRPTSAGCGPGAPGTAFTDLVTDPTGVATTRVQDTIRPGTTGVWVLIERPSPHSQDPAEYYTSDFVVPV